MRKKVSRRNESYPAWNRSKVAALWYRGALAAAMMQRKRRNFLTITALAVRAQRRISRANLTMEMRVVETTSVLVSACQKYLMCGRCRGTLNTFKKGIGGHEVGQYDIHAPEMVKRRFDKPVDPSRKNGTNHHWGCSPSLKEATLR